MDDIERFKKEPIHLNDGRIVLPYKDGKETHMYKFIVEWNAIREKLSSLNVYLSRIKIGCEPTDYARIQQKAGIHKTHFNFIGEFKNMQISNIKNLKEAEKTELMKAAMSLTEDEQRIYISVFKDAVLNEENAFRLDSRRCKLEAMARILGTSEVFE